MTFEAALELVLELEGGYSNHPADTGGATNYGITDATYDAWLGRDGDVRDITHGEVRSIYRRFYWEPGRCEALPPAVRLVHFDGCVNHGVGLAARMLQRAAGVQDDGIIGPVTLAAVGRMPPGQLVAMVLRERVRLYHLRAARVPGQQVFLAGWMTRLVRVAAWTIAGGFHG